MVDICDTNSSLKLRLDYSTIIRKWSNQFLTYAFEYDKQEFEESLPKRTEILSENVWFIIQKIYETEQAFIVDLDKGLRGVFGNNVELGGGSFAVRNITDILKQEGVIQNIYPFRLTRQHRDALDQIYLNKCFS